MVPSKLCSWESKPFPLSENNLSFHAGVKASEQGISVTSPGSLLLHLLKTPRRGNRDRRPVVKGRVKSLPQTWGSAGSNLELMV